MTDTTETPIEPTYNVYYSVVEVKARQVDTPEGESLITNTGPKFARQGDYIVQTTVHELDVITVVESDVFENEYSQSKPSTKNVSTPDSSKEAKKAGK